jgi:hypothetical protein
MRVLAWEREQGKHYGYGVWYDKGSKPGPDQLVNFTTGRDYRDVPEDVRVSPLTPWERGLPETVRFVVYEKSGRTPGLGRVVAETRVRDDARARVRDLDARRIDREKVLNPKEWEKLDFSPQLRQFVDREPER